MAKITNLVFQYGNLAKQFHVLEGGCVEELRKALSAAFLINPSEVLAFRCAGGFVPLDVFLADPVTFSSTAGETVAIVTKTGSKTLTGRSRKNKLKPLSVFKAAAYAVGIAPSLRKQTQSKEEIDAAHATDIGADGKEASIAVDDDEEEYVLSEADMKLPAGWERVEDPDVGVFYVDHTNHTTSWRHPALGKEPITSSGHLPAYAVVQRVQSLRAKTGFGDLDLQGLMKAFKAEALGQNSLDFKAFSKAIARAVGKAPEMPMDALFKLFDEDNSGLIDSQEFCVGASFLCAGDLDTKIDVAFDLIDTDGNGSISKDELAVYLGAMDRIYSQGLGTVDEGKATATSIRPAKTPEEMDEAVEICFIAADQDKSGGISPAEFRAFVTSDTTHFPWLSVLGDHMAFQDVPEEEEEAPKKKRGVFRLF